MVRIAALCVFPMCTSLPVLKINRSKDLLRLFVTSVRPFRVERAVKSIRKIRKIVRRSWLSAERSGAGDVIKYNNRFSLPKSSEVRHASSLNGTYLSISVKAPSRNSFSKNSCIKWKVQRDIILFTVPIMTLCIRDDRNFEAVKRYYRARSWKYRRWRQENRGPKTIHHRSRGSPL